METHKHVLLVGGAGLTSLIEAVERRGMKAVLVTLPETLDGYNPPPCVAHFEGIDFRQPLKAIRRILELARRFDVAGIVPVSEFGLEASAAVAEILKLPTNPLAAVRNTRDKAKMRRALAKADLDPVRFAECRTLDEATAFMQRIGGPIFVKPVGSTGSDGVSRVDSLEDLPRALDAVARSLVSGAALCEEYLEGPEVSVEGVFCDGKFVPLVVSDKHIDGRRVEFGHDQPSRISTALREQICDLTARMLKELGVDHGATHTEFKLTSDGPRLVETHTRMAGANMPRITELTTGVDLEDFLVAAAVGENPKVAPAVTGRFAAVRWLIARQPGEIAALELPALRREDGEMEVGAWARPGSVVNGSSTVGNQIAYAIGAGDDMSGAVAAAEGSLSRVRLEWVTAAGRVAEKAS